MTSPVLVTLVLDGAQPGGSSPLPPLTSGYAELIPNSQLVAPAYQGAGWIPPVAVQAQFRNAGGPPTVQLLPTDDTNVSPSGWQWKITFNGVAGNPVSFYFLLPLAEAPVINGKPTRYLSQVASVSPVTPGQSFVPLPVTEPSSDSQVLGLSSASPLVTEWVDGGGGSGTVTSVSGEPANGFTVSVADGSTTPQVEVGTSVTGLLKGNGTGVSAAAAGTDYLAPAGDGSQLTGITAGQVGAASTGALTSEAATRASADTALGNAITALANEAGQPSGLATLDSGGHVPAGQLANALPVPSGTASAGMAPLATGSGEASAWGFSGAGATVVVPKPTGLTATDTPNAVAAIASLAANETLLFQDGIYQVDSNALVIRNLSNFAVRSAGRTVIAQAPNRSGLPNNTTGNIFTIADCTDFTVEGITFDGMRDTVAPLTPLTASASSGQPSVTVASGQGARYLAGQYLSVFGGLGTADSNLQDASLTISSVTPGGGSGGGDLITFTTNLANSYTQVSSTVFSDGFGPYAYAGAYLTPYQVTTGGTAGTVAGRSLHGEDQQNGLHLISCQRFSVSRVTSRNLWESPVKLGTGFASTSLTDGCSQGTVSNCTSYHAYDQGVSLWVSSQVTVSGCMANATGWAGCALTLSDHCTITGNKFLNSVYRVPGDNSSGCGLAIEGGRSNQVAGNIITGTYSDGMRLWTSPIFGVASGSAPTLSAFLAAQTAAGTSVAVSSTAHLTAGFLYSIEDGSKTEAVSVASIVDGTHVTFSEEIQFAHASGSYVTARIAQDNTLTANTIYGAGNAGILHQTAVRSVITGCTIKISGAVTAGGIGVNMQSSTTGATSLPVALGGNGTVITGCTIGFNSGRSVYATNSEGILIENSQLWGAQQGNTPVVALSGVTNCAVKGNRIYGAGASGTQGQGIFCQNGTSPCARVTIEGNVVYATANEGILLIAGDSYLVKGNIANSCGGDAGINLRGVSNSEVEGNTANSNHNGGIVLENNSSTGCTNNRVTGNTCRDDGSGVNYTSGATWTQAYGIRETGNSNLNLFTGNECDANGTGQLATSGANSLAWANIISGVLTEPPVLALNYGGTFGDASDGAVTLDGSTTYNSWSSLSGSTYTLTRDVYATSLTVNNGVTFKPSGYRIFCQGTFTSNGTVSMTGGNASGASGGTGVGSGTLHGNVNGTAGGTGAGTQNSNQNGSGGGSGGAGGSGTSGAGGPARACQITAVAPYYKTPAPVLAGVIGVAGTQGYPCGAQGGSSGAGDGTNSGGGGGAGGGIIAIMAWSIVNNGTITVAGGNGGSAAAGNCGGGGGGGGGVILGYSLSAWTAGTMTVSGGSLGSGTGTGTAGSAGGSGFAANVIVQ